MKEAAYDEVFHSQAHYRALLDSMARPGKINALDYAPLKPPAGFDDASAYVALALLDADVSFSALRSTEGVAEYLISNTNSKEASPTAAEFQFTDGARAAEAIAQAKPGTLLYPDTGATIVVSVQELSTEPIPESVRLTMQGPGIKERAHLWVKGIHPIALDQLQEKNQEYPLGVDVVFCCGSGPGKAKLACIPRTSSVSWSL